EKKSSFSASGKTRWSGVQIVLRGKQCFSALKKDLTARKSPQARPLHPLTTNDIIPDTLKSEGM
ncbi:MAG: hypothetical protein QMC98_03385, partial [Candidatus Thermoplasmatota archaeon]|nr:hypothetical protein [Candidatus Thermoplasmatota archaeon]